MATMPGGDLTLVGDLIDALAAGDRACCVAITRVLRSVGATAAPMSDKLRLAKALLSAPATSAFPDCLRFVFDWLCGVFRAKVAPAGSALPRSDQRCWRLLNDVLDCAVVSTNGPQNGSYALPGHANMPPGLRARVMQNSRLLLQAAPSGLGVTGLATDQEEDSASRLSMVELYACTQHVMRMLLVDESSWFRPGAEAVVEYASTIVSCAARRLDAFVHASASLRAAPDTAADHECKHILHAAGDALHVVVALQAGEVQPRKLLALVTEVLLQHVLALRAACMACAATNSELGRLASSMAATLDDSLRAVLVHADHLHEYEAALPLLISHSGAPTEGAGAGTGSGSGHSKGRASVSGSSTNYTATTLEAISRLVMGDTQSAAARAAVAATATLGAANNDSRRALVRPVQPHILQWFAAEHDRVQAHLKRDRATRQRLGLQAGIKASSDEADSQTSRSTTMGFSFSMFSWLTAPLLVRLRASIAICVAAMAGEAASKGQAAGSVKGRGGSLPTDTIAGKGRWAEVRISPRHA